MAKQQRQIRKKVLGMPTDEEPNSQTQTVTANQESIGGESRERLSWTLPLLRNRIMHIIRPVSVVFEILSQSADQMPNTGHKKRDQNRPAGDPKRLPERGLDHGDEKGRKKE